MPTPTLTIVLSDDEWAQLEHYGRRIAERCGHPAEAHQPELAGYAAFNAGMEDMARRYGKPRVATSAGG